MDQTMQGSNMMKDEQAGANAATSKSAGSGDGQMRKIIMMVGIAMMVGTILLSMYLPMFSIFDQLG